MYDTIIKGGRWFDGTGSPSAVRALGIRNGRIAVVSAASRRDHLPARHRCDREVGDIPA